MSDQQSLEYTGNLALALLESLSVATLRRTGPRSYVFFGRMPAFYARIFECSQDAPNVTPWERSDMFNFFLDDAEEFFESGANGSFHSGLWQEDGVDQDSALIATAITLPGKERLLVLRCLNEEYADRTRILRKAREHLLERRELSNNLELYKQKSNLDELTSLYNRAFFMDSLRQAAERAVKDGEPLALIFFDIDDFKNINDTFGHLAGDSVLRELGRILRGSLRRGDLPARYGGEEFAVLSSFLGQPGTKKLAEKLCKSVARHNFGAIPSVTISVGCTDHLRGEPPEDFIRRADEALYDAKRSGKNRVCCR